MDPIYQEYFTLFAKVSKQIHANKKVPEILASIVENITQILGAKGSIFWILNQRDQTIETKISHGFDFQSLSRVDYPALCTLFDPKTPGPIVIQDARKDDRIPDLERLGKRLINSITGLYLDISGPFQGLLAVYFTGHRTLLDHEITLITALGEQGAIALEKALGYDQEMRDLYGQIVQGFALAIEARDPVTHGHSLTVARLAQATAEAMGLGPEEVRCIFHAAILHDIGKLGTRDAILERLGTLNPGEMAAIQRHPSLGAQILRPLSFLGEVAPLVQDHHELYNGRGYPEGKKGEAIPLGARILTVCDAFETMVSGRPGIPRMDLAQALTQLTEGAGTRFDPAVVQAFFSMVKTCPEILAQKESVESCLSILTQNISRLADQNQIRKKLANPFAGFF